LDPDLVIVLREISMKSEDLRCTHAAFDDYTSTSADLKVVFKLANTISVFADGVYREKTKIPVRLSLTSIELTFKIHVDFVNNSIEVRELNVIFKQGSVDPAQFYWDVLMNVLNKAIPDYGLPLAALVTGLNQATSSLGAGNFVDTALGDPGPLLTLVNHSQLNNVVKEKINEVIRDAKEWVSLYIYWKTMASYASVEGRLDPLVSDWMSQPDIQKKLLRDLHLPGTHDSGATQLDNGLAQTNDAIGGGIKYKEIGFLWRLHAGMAPPNGHWPFPNDSNAASPIFVGKDLYSEIIGRVVRGIAEAGSLDFKTQLESGIRWFDLRVYLGVDDDFYLQHALRGPLLTDVLKQVRSFIDAHPKAKELVFLDLSHANFDNTAAARVSKLVNDILTPKNILHFDNHSGSDKFDFKDLADKTVESLVGEQTKVMVLNSDFWGRQYPAPVTNTQGFEDSEKAILRRFGHCITPAEHDIVPWLVDLLKSGRQTDGLLKLLATHHNGSLEEVLSKNSDARSANVVSVDWFQCSSGKLPVPQILALNSTS